MAGGLGIGFFIADSRSVNTPMPGAEVGRLGSGELKTDGASLVANRLMTVAVEEAQEVVLLGCEDAHRVQNALSEVEGNRSDPVRVRSNHLGVEVTNGGRRAEPLSSHIYRVQRRGSVEPQFQPFSAADDVEISVSPLLDTSIVDPWGEAAETNP